MTGSATSFAATGCGVVIGFCEADGAGVEATAGGAGSTADAGGEGLFTTGAEGLMAGVSEGVGLGRADDSETRAAGSAGPVIRPLIRSTCSWARPAKMLGLMSSPHPWIRSSSS